MNLNLHESDIDIKKLNIRDFEIFLLPLLIFSLYLYVYNPGILTFDTFSQLHQIVTGQFTNGQPFFHTFIEIICLKIYNSPVSIAALQIVVFSLMWMIICKYHRDDEKGNINQFVLQFAVTCIICLIPINAVYSITLTNNILFSYFLMFLCFLNKVMIDKKGQVDLGFIIVMAVTMAFVAELNPYGIAIAVISLIVIAMYLFRQNETQKLHIILPALTIIFILLIASISMAFDVGNDNLSGQNQTNDNLLNIEQAKSQYFSSINATPTNSVEDASPVNLGNDKYNLINSFVSQFQDNVILNALFDNGLTYLFASIILLILVYVITNRKEVYLILLPLLPLMLNIQNVSTTNLIQNSQIYANVLVFYMIIIILINIWLNKDENISSILTKPIVDEKPKENNYVYQSFDSNEEIYGVVENEPNTDIYDDFESKIDDLTLEDINEILNESSTTDKTPTQEPAQPETTTQKPQEPVQPKTTTQEPAQIDESSDEEEYDLLDEILKEIEMERK